MRFHCIKRVAALYSTPLHSILLGRLTRLPGLAALTFGVFTLAITACSDPPGPQRPGGAPELNPPRELNDPVPDRPELRQHDLSHDQVFSTSNTSPARLS